LKERLINMKKLSMVGRKRVSRNERKYYDYLLYI
jgi:hypothetical protein